MGGGYRPRQRIGVDVKPVSEAVDPHTLSDKHPVQESSEGIIADRPVGWLLTIVVPIGIFMFYNEKVFSIFEPHTEWISKGKAGVPQELGLRVCILEDQYGLILHHRVMEKETDDKVAVAMVDAAQNKFPNLQGCSFDKGYYSLVNKTALKDKLTLLVLPMKGKRNKAELEEETAEEFTRSKRKHSAVESGINGLENHGLDRCPDHAIDGFKRYVSLSVLARDLQVIGHHLQKKELKRV